MPHDGLTSLLARAERILAFTGAGVSTASKIPDFRGPDGVWHTRTPVEYPAFMRSEEARLEALVTQNVDGLHRAAGTAPEKLVELH